MDVKCRLNKIYESLNTKMEERNFLIRWLFNRGVQAKQWRMANGYDNTHWFYDMLVFNSVCITKET